MDRPLKRKSLAKSAAGLTILEVLIALSIFALIGVASYRMLTSVIRTQHITIEHSEELGQLQKTLLIMERDLEQIVKRSIRTSSNKPLVYLSLNGGEYPLEFTRTGWRNPLLLSRSSMQRVAYSIGSHPDQGRKDSLHFADNKKYLLRHYWRNLDRMDQVQMINQPLLANVESIDFYIVNSSGKHRRWPLQADKGAPETDQGKRKNEPLAIGFNMNLIGMGQVNRLFGIN